METKIIQISSIFYDCGTGVFGLGEDSKVYLWDLDKGDWELWVRNDYKITKE